MAEDSPIYEQFVLHVLSRLAEGVDTQSDAYEKLAQAFALFFRSGYSPVGLAQYMGGVLQDDAEHSDRS